MITTLINIEVISAAIEPNTNQTEINPSVSISIIVKNKVIQNQIAVADPNKKSKTLLILGHLHRFNVSDSHSQCKPCATTLTKYYTLNYESNINYSTNFQKLPKLFQKS